MEGAAEDHHVVPFLLPDDDGFVVGHREQLFQGVLLSVKGLLRHLKPVNQLRLYIYDILYIYYMCWI